MGLAKYYEEIEERWIANTNVGYEVAIENFFRQLPSFSIRAGEAYLLRGERRMEDMEVCEVGETLTLKVKSKPGAAEVEIELQDDSGIRQMKIGEDGSICVQFKQTGVTQILVSYGGYLKQYTIQAVEAFRVQELPDFARLIQSISDNPPEWTVATFGKFRDQLEEILVQKSVPKVFAEGVIEYHLALFHEEQRLPSYRERFEAAYAKLRWFIPYSDIARLICAYYLYCANEFEAVKVLWKGSRGRLCHAVNFFLDKNRAKAADTESSGKGAGLPLLVALPDLILFQAIEAQEAGMTENAAELVAFARRSTRADFDRERAARVTYIEAHIKRSAGDKTSSRLAFESLLHCPWKTIADSAAKYII